MGKGVGDEILLGKMEVLIKKQVDAVMEECVTLSKGITTMSTEVKKFQSDLNLLSKEMKKLEIRFKLFQEEVSQAFQKCGTDNFEYIRELQLESIEKERHRRRKNLIFFGIKTEMNKTAEESIHDILKDNLNVSLSYHDTDQIYRIGRKDTAPILVQFTTEKQLWNVLKLAKNLKGTGIAIARDKPRKMQLVEKKNLELLKEARRNKKQVKWIGNDLMIDGLMVDQIFPDYCISDIKWKS